MEIDSTRRLRTSSSRNFSRPFPSPLSTGALSMPTRLSQKRELPVQIPLSASHGNALRSTASHGCLATNRLIDFDGAFQHSRPPTKVPYSNKGTWNIEDSNKTSYSPLAFTKRLYVSADHNVGTKSPVRNSRLRLWRLLEQDRDILNIDLFWPDTLDRSKERHEEWNLPQTEREDSTIIPYDGLQPLLAFRNLHTLVLSGMMRSHQLLTWATCWLNPNLTTLTLEMALEPLLNVLSGIPYYQVDHTWSRPSCNMEVEEPEYLGSHGSGVLHEEFGNGEYLDTQAIMIAQLEIAEEIPESNLRYLPVKKLTLLNFVIDSGPILRWFDPEKLQEINLKYGCVDAGMHLSEAMQHVRVLSPKPRTLVGMARVVTPGELKIIELKKGKFISRSDAKAVRNQ